MESFFVSFPGVPALPELPGDGNAPVKKSTPGDIDDFGAFLEAYVKGAGVFAPPFALPGAKSCGSSCGSTKPVSSPCPLQATPASCSSQSVLPATCGTPDSFGEFSKLISDALDMVENFTVTLRLGEGNVTVSGARNESGAFTFAVEGKKEALVTFFTWLFENLKAWMEKEGETLSCPQLSCQKPECALSSSGGEDAIPVEVVEGIEGASPGDVPSPEEAIPLEALDGGTLPEFQSTPVSAEGGELASGEVDEIPEGGIEGASPDGTSSDRPEVPQSLRGESSRGKTHPAEVQKVLGVQMPKEARRIPKRGAGVDPERNAVSLFSLERGARGEALQEIRVPVTSQRDFTRIFDEVLRVASEVKGRKEIVLQLEPEHLGSITVRLEEKGGQIHCLWEVANPETRELLVKFLPAFEAQLNAQGMPFANFLGDGRNTSGFSSFRWMQTENRDGEEENPVEDFGLFRVNLLV